MASYALVVDDAFKSLAEGTALRITDQDLLLFLNVRCSGSFISCTLADCASTQSRFLRHSIGTNRPRDVLQFVYPIAQLRWMSLGGHAWGQIIKISRNMAKRISERERAFFPFTLSYI